MLEDRLVQQLFVRMQSTYGHLWSSRFGSAELFAAAKAEWARALGRYDAMVVSRAVEGCQQQYDKPPTLPEFLRLCRPVPEAHRAYRALPAPLADPQVVRAGLDEVKRLLRR